MAQAVLALAGGAGVAALLAHREVSRARTALALLGVGAVTVLLAWIASQASPAWALRYLAVGLAPFLVVAAGGLAHAGRLGVAGLIIVCVMGIGDAAPSAKSNVRTVAENLTPSLRAGDLVVSTQPEQVPVLHYYLPDGLRYATLTGPVPDLGVTDWRDGTERLEAAGAARDLEPLLDALPVGRRLVLVQPDFHDLRAWQAPWTKAVRIKSLEWSQFLSNDLRFRVVTVEPPSPVDIGPHPVQATVYVKTRP
jgi:mannosyltransferase